MDVLLELVDQTARGIDIQFVKDILITEQKVTQNEKEYVCGGGQDFVLS